MGTVASREGKNKYEEEWKQQ